MQGKEGKEQNGRLSVNMLLCSVFIYSTVAGHKCEINLVVIVRFADKKNNLPPKVIEKSHVTSL